MRKTHLPNSKMVTICIKSFIRYSPLWLRPLGRAGLSVHSVAPLHNKRKVAGSPLLQADGSTEHPDAAPKGRLSFLYPKPWTRNPMPYLTSVPSCGCQIRDIRAIRG
jgi:hypothetical protein